MLVLKTLIFSPEVFTEVASRRNLSNWFPLNQIWNKRQQIRNTISQIAEDQKSKLSILHYNQWLQEKKEANYHFSRGYSTAAFDEDKNESSIQSNPAELIDDLEDDLEPYIPREDVNDNVSVERKLQPSVSVKPHTSLHKDHESDIWRNRLRKRKPIGKLASEMEVVEPTVESEETDAKMSVEPNKSGNLWGDRLRKCRNRQKGLN